MAQSLPSLSGISPDIQNLAHQAGNAIMRYHRQESGLKVKLDGSPVTLADQASEDIIIAGLNTITPDIPVIAEEQNEAGLGPDISDHAQYWLVDPLDGTKEFVRGTADFTVNIGLIDNGVPVFGVVYLPATGDMYVGGKGIGAYLNNTPLAIRPYNPDTGLTIIGSASHPDSDKGRARARLLKHFKIAGYTTRGSGVKFCMIADGSAHLYPRFVPTYEWDTAAAHAMLIEVGGDIIDYTTLKRLEYGKMNFHNGNLITGTNEILDELIPVIKQVT
jgi:3'(2'), 5'-bisphosphate nucleotidase